VSDIVPVLIGQETEGIADTVGGTIVEGGKANDDATLAGLQHEAVGIGNGIVVVTPLDGDAGQHHTGLISLLAQQAIDCDKGAIGKPEEPLAVTKLHRMGLTEAIGAIKTPGIEHPPLQRAVEHCHEMTADSQITSVTKGDKRLDDVARLCVKLLAEMTERQD
jgi:hypothetical protein